MSINLKQHIKATLENYPDKTSFLFQQTAHLLVILFPSATILVRHGATGTYTVLMLFGLFLGWKGWKRLTGFERLIFIGFVLYFLSAALSLFHSEHLHNGISRMEKYARFVLFIPAYMSIRTYKIDLMRFFPISLEIGALSLFSTTVVQIHLMNIERAEGAITPIMFGDFAILIATLLILAALLIRKSLFRKYIDILLACMATYASFYSGTRNAWLLLPLLFLMLLFYYRNKVHIVYLSLLALGFMAITSGIVFIKVPKRMVWESSIIKGIDNIYSFFHEDPQAYRSSNLRLNMWRNSLIAFKKNPILGIGLGDYQSDMKKLIDSGASYSSAKILYEHTAHSSFFHCLVITGAFGFLTMLFGLFIFPLYAFKRILASAKTKCDRFAAIAGFNVILGYAVFGIGTTWIASHRFISTYLAFLIILLSCGMAERKKEEDCKVL